MTITQGTVKIPFEFFRKVRRDYRNWKQATIRELIQNSVDAGATRIDINIGLRFGSNAVTMMCSDNGHGMNRDTLENVFLVLGGSKKEANSLGGFGMAKMVLFSADQYTIAINGWAAEGRGSEYTLSPQRPETGVTVTLEYAGMLVEDWQQEVKAYVALCNLTTTIVLNGEVLPQNVGDYDFEGPEGFVYRPWEGEYSQITWRSRGLAMFTDSYWSSGNSNIIGYCELGSVNPLDTFTTNRDAFINTSVRSKQVEHLVLQHKVKMEGDVYCTTLNRSAPWAGNLEYLENNNVTEYYPSNFHIYVEGFMQRRNAKTAAYMNDAEFKKVLASRSLAKLARQWAVACRLVLSCEYALSNGVTLYAAKQVPADLAGVHAEDDVTTMEHYYNGVRVEMGFGFVPGAEALCTGRSHLYLNPRTVPDDLMLIELIDIAMHEVTHLWVSGHGENFTTTEMQIRRSMRRWMDERQLTDLLKQA